MAKFPPGHPHRETWMGLYMRLLIGSCPAIERDGRICALCTEAAEMFGYTVDENNNVQPHPEDLRVHNL